MTKLAELLSASPENLASLQLEALRTHVLQTLDRMTGYAQKTADLTSALADQTRAQQGNVKGVVALKLAQLAEHFEIQSVAFDRWRIEMMKKASADVGFAPERR